MAKLVLGQIAVQVLPANGMVNAVHAALHCGKEALDGVRMNVTPDVLFGAVADSVMTAEKLSTDPGVG